MKKRIYLNFIGMIMLCAALMTVSVSLIISNSNRNQEKAAIRDRAMMAADLLNKGVGQYAQMTDYANYSAETARITIISPDGTVILDNKTTVETMDNHSDREEFIQAVERGSGESVRYSQTLRTETYYYAIRLDDGSILRVSRNMSSINAVISIIIPAIVAIMILVIVVAAFFARSATRKILEPLEYIDFTGENVAIYDELIPYAKRIDQQKREINSQIDALKNRADTIEVITDSMREGLILIDASGKVLIANKSAEDIFHMDDMVQQSILQICREIDFQQGIKQCLWGGNSEITLEFNDRTYNIFFSPARSKSGLHDGVNGVINGGVVLFLDATEKHEAEKQRREFSANVSHELKTPLTSISALSEMIENGMAKNEDIQDFAEKITVQAKRLINIINDIIKLSEFDEGKADDETETFDLFELTENVANVLRENQKNVEININGEHFDISANRRMVDELLYNLIDNGIKYNKDNGNVTVSLSRIDEQCKIVVSDTGIGIPREHHGRVFERFYRVEKSRSKKTGGTGLGLSIVKHITEHHDGHVDLYSTVGAGTEVTCWLRL